MSQPHQSCTPYPAGFYRHLKRNNFRTRQQDRQLWQRGTRAKGKTYRIQAEGKAIHGQSDRGIDGNHLGGSAK